MAGRSDHGAAGGAPHAPRGPVREGVLTGDFWDACVRVAGALAEAGVSSIEVCRPGESAGRLGARATDLPGALAAAPVGTRLEARVGGVGGVGGGGWIEVVVEPKQIRWRSDDPGLIAALGR